MKRNTMKFRFSEYLLNCQATLKFSRFKVQLHTLNRIWSKPGGVRFECVLN